MQTWLEAATFDAFPEVEWIIARQHRPQSAAVALHGANVRIVEAPASADTPILYVDFLHSLKPAVIFSPFADSIHYRKNSTSKQVSIDYGMEDFYFRKYVPFRSADEILESHEFALSSFDGIVTASETSLKDLTWFFPEYKHKLQVVYPSAQFESHTVDSVPEQLQDTRYFVLMGYELKKNIRRITLAFDSFKTATGSEAKLVLIGKPGYGAEKLDAHIQSLAHSADILPIGYVSDELKQALLTNAHAVIALSIYEGFGISALEALHAGKPVLVSDNGSLKEVVGKAGYLADPFSIPSIAEQLTRIDKLTENPKRKFYQQRIAAFDAGIQARTLLHYLSSLTT